MVSLSNRLVTAPLKDTTTALSGEGWMAPLTCQVRGTRPGGKGYYRTHYHTKPRHITPSSFPPIFPPFCFPPHPLSFPPLLPSSLSPPLSSLSLTFSQVSEVRSSIHASPSRAALSRSIPHSTSSRWVVMGGVDGRGLPRSGGAHGNQSKRFVAAEGNEHLGEYQ